MRIDVLINDWFCIVVLWLPYKFGFVSFFAHQGLEERNQQCAILRTNQLILQNQRYVALQQQKKTELMQQQLENSKFVIAVMKQSLKLV